MAGLTNEQRIALKAAIIADPALTVWVQANNEQAIADYYNVTGTVYVWRTNVTRSEIYHRTSGEATTWNWTTYKNQAVAEQNAWVQIFMGDEANFALPNLRSGVDAIFSGAGAAAAQRAHIAAIAKRFASRVEALFATGLGTNASPSVMTFEGSLTAQDIADTMRS